MNGKQSKGPRSVPTVLQLPGGVTIKGFAFRITRLDAQGRAVEFELATGNEDSDCVLWATPQFLAQPLPADLKKRVLDRIEESIEGKQYETRERTYVKGRAHGISETSLPEGIVKTKSGVIMHEANQEAALKLAQASGLKGMAMMLERDDDYANDEDLDEE